VPALHDAVLDDDLHAALAGVVDQPREGLLGQGDVLLHAQPGVPADERADGLHAEHGRGVDRVQQVRGDLLAPFDVRVEVVLVVRQRGQRQAVLGEQLGDLGGLRVAEVRDVDVAGLEVAPADLGPDRDLQGRVIVLGSPRGDVRQRDLRQAGGQEPESHVRTPRSRSGARPSSGPRR
jgi:hypothetical protein